MAEVSENRRHDQAKGEAAFRRQIRNVHDAKRYVDADRQEPVNEPQLQAANKQSHENASP